MPAESGLGARYFRVPLSAFDAIASHSGDPDAVAAWLVLRRFAFGHQRELTAAGALSISRALEITRPRAGKLLKAMLALRYGDRGEHAVLMTAADWNTEAGQSVPAIRCNAPVYVMPDAGDEYAYLPDLLIPGAQARSYFSDLCQLEAEAGLDAIRAFVLAHAKLSCGDYLGADPAEFASTAWETEGLRHGYELGLIGCNKGRSYWLVAERECATATWTAIEWVTGGRGKEHAARFWAAVYGLCQRGLLYRVAIVTDRRGRFLYPLWVFGQSHRERLERDLGMAGNLASRFRGQASRADLDAPDHFDSTGLSSESQLYVCAIRGSDLPVVRTVYCPTLIAPTPDNMAGLASAAARSREWV